MATLMCWITRAKKRTAPGALDRPAVFLRLHRRGDGVAVRFFVIATDSARFRPMITMSVFEKLSCVLTVGVLYLRGLT